MDKEAQKIITIFENLQIVNLNFRKVKFKRSCKDRFRSLFMGKIVLNSSGTESVLLRTFVFVTLWFTIFATTIILIATITTDKTITTSFKEILINKEMIITYFGLIAACYWNYRSLYSSKWEFCSAQIKETDMIIAKEREKEYYSKLLSIVFLDLSTALKLIDMRMWRDEAFYRFFFFQYLLSIRYLKGNETVLSTEECERTDIYDARSIIHKAYTQIESELILYKKNHKQDDPQG